MLKAVFFKENGERMEKKNSMNHIVIIGFKGSGKTRVGKALAKALDLPFVDVDRIIEKRMNMMVKEIYHRFGEAYYRALETLVIKELARDPERKVISLSYGLPAQEQNQAIIPMLGTIIYLKASWETIKKRLESKNPGDEHASNEENEQDDKMKKALKARDPIYESFADITVVTGIMRFEDLVDSILAKLKEQAR